MCPPKDIQDLAVWFRARARETDQLHYTLLMLRAADSLSDEAVSQCSSARGPKIPYNCDLKGTPPCPRPLQS